VKGYRPVDLTADDKLNLARKLRRSLTEAEKNLWAHLRNRRLYGLKFKRQAPVCAVYADFLCESAKLIVEVDGGQHAPQEERDLGRTKILESAGFHVLRFWNNDVMSNIEGVLSEIAKTAGVLPPHPVRPFAEL
jgi:very-short-patch-repair endonuclease